MFVIPAARKMHPAEPVDEANGVYGLGDVEFLQCAWNIGDHHSHFRMNEVTAVLFLLGSPESVQMLSAEPLQMRNSKPTETLPLA